MKTDKIEKKERVLYLDSDTLNGDINDVVNRIQDIPKKVREQNPNLFHKFELEVCGYDGLEIDVMGTRWETDEEFTKRMLLHKKQEEKREKDRIKREERKKKSTQKQKEQKFELYQQLKKEFEK